MRFKDETDKEFWYQWAGRNPPYTPFQTLRRIVSAIDDLSIATGHGEITVTSFLRPGDTASYHSKAHAVDIRVHGKSRAWYEAMILFKHVLRTLDWQIQLVPHLGRYNSPNEHIHIEVDNGSLGKQN